MNMITTRTLPKNGCWIYENKRYRCTLDSSNLPYVNAKYKRILNAHQIPYRTYTKLALNPFGSATFQEFCEYWNPNVFEEKELSLPLYVRMPDYSYHYCGKNYSRKVATSDTIEAAAETKKFIEEKIEEYEQVLRIVHHYTFAKKQLVGRIATVCMSSDTPYMPSYDINVNHDHYLILRPMGRIYIGDWVAIFNMSKIACNAHITLQVPKQIVGLVIGKEGSNIKAWANEIGVKKIQVIPI